MKITKSNLKEMILEILQDSMSGAELYSKLFDKPLRLVKDKDAEKKEKPETEPKKVSKLKDLSDGEIQSVLNRLGYTPGALGMKVKKIIAAMSKPAPGVSKEKRSKDIKTIDLVSKELMAYFDDLPKLGRTSISEGYVITKNDPISIKQIIANWSDGIQPAPSENYDMMATLDDVLEYRDMSPQPLQLSIEEMEDLKTDLKQTGLTDSVVIEVGKNGQAAVTGGNQMIELAKHLNIKEIPVSFVFKDHVQKANKITAEPAEIRKAVEDQLEEPIYGQSVQDRGSSLDV
tara:strand:+ start:2595 stop:3458 length:864 start_codon:yes stop_codon:yes gene_type:complete